MIIPLFEKISCLVLEAQADSLAVLALREYLIATKPASTRKMLAGDGTWPPPFVTLLTTDASLNPEYSQSWQILPLNAKLHAPISQNFDFKLVVIL